MKKLVASSFLAGTLFILSGCQLPLKTQVLMAAKGMNLREDEKAFIRFRQVFTEKARGHHLSLLKSTRALWPADYKNDETLKSLVALVRGSQHQAMSSEVRELLGGDSEWLGKGFVALLRNHKPDSDDDPDHGLWQPNLDLTLACFANINTADDRSLEDLNSDALACLVLMANDAHRQSFACFAGFLLDDAYIRGVSDSTLAE